jgi:hypothetical protein
MTVCDDVQIKYKGDGTTVLYTFPFEYINETDVQVFLYDETTETWVNQQNKFVFANATTIEFLTAPPAPTADIYNILISRVTDISKMVATFYPGSSIRAQDLNDDFDQLRLTLQEQQCRMDGLVDETIQSSFTEPQQQAGTWRPANDTKLATSDAIRARHDVYVQDTKPEEPVYEQPGKGWQNTDDCWSSYWNPEAGAWVAYVNTGPRGEQGPQGPAGVGGQVFVGNVTNVPNKPDGSVGDATVTNTGDQYQAFLDFGIPVGEKGETGKDLALDNNILYSGPPTDDPKNFDDEIWIDVDETLWWSNGGVWVDLGSIKGSQGDQGVPGEAATVTVGSTTTGNPGTDADVTNSGDSQNAVLNFTIPRGDTGSPGTAATITVGTTDTGAPGTNASVNNSGNSTAAVLNFVIPEGVKGEKGDPASPIVLLGTVPNAGSLPPTGNPTDAYLDTSTGDVYTWTDAEGWINLGPITGPEGPAGDAATITVGSTTTGAPGTPAAVTNSGDSANAVLEFTIPQGDKGDQGDAALIAVGSTTTGDPGTNASVVNGGTSSNAVLFFTIPRGDQGLQGIQGDGATIAVKETVTLAPGSQATVLNQGTETDAEFVFGIPTGPVGPSGTAATVDVGSTTTGAAGTQASVTNSGNSTNAVFEFTIPQGAQGIQGDKGTTTVGTTTTLPAGSSATVVDSSGDPTNAVLDFGIPKGDQGDQGDKGDAATITVGTVASLPPGQTPTVTNSGTSNDAIFNFGLPQGEKGDPGTEEYDSGTTCLFYQAAAPVGYTKVTTHDNAALRVVSGGGGGSGGTQAFTSAFQSHTPSGSVSVSVSNHTLSTSQLAQHNHTVYYSRATSTASTGGSFGTVTNIHSSGGTNNQSTGSEGSNNGHSHGASGSFSGSAINLAVKYVDIIIATKN